MNTEQLGSGFRSIAVALLAYAAGKGWISQDDAVQLTPVIVAIGIAIYGMYVKRDKGLLDAAKTVKGVEEIKVDTTVATPAVVAAANSKKPEEAKIIPK